MTTTVSGRSVLPGRGTGPVLHSDTALSFMGGIDPTTGRIIDQHHPLTGAYVGGAVLVLPSGRGSCSGSGVMLELLVNGHAPAALVFCYPEPILTLGVVIAAELFGVGLPVLEVGADDFAALASMGTVTVDDATISESGSAAARGPEPYVLAEPDLSDFTLSPQDKAALAGTDGEAARIAARIVVRAAQLEGAHELIDVELGHIDGCFYQGPASLALARRLRDLGGRVRIPTTTNAIRMDRRRWRAQGIDASVGVPSEQLADALVDMGIQPTYTCAPYLLPGAPVFGQQIAWAESNAVMYANAVLGARTMKYPDYLDLMVALTGRAPHAGCHVPAQRRASVRVDVRAPAAVDDAYYPTLGYHVGLLATQEIPVLTGLETSGMDLDDLKAFGAAFATTSAAPMFHIVGVTPEATSLAEVVVGDEIETVVVTAEGLAATWSELDTAADRVTDIVALGNPHFSLTEVARLVELIEGRTKSPDVALVVTCGRDTMLAAREAGHVDALTAFGADLVNDTCWCLVDETLLPASRLAVTTNSAKYAHYGPSTTAKGFHLRSLAECVDAACTGQVADHPPAWLETEEPVA